jgi:pyruvate dehydrogenase E1 component alpha subunit
MRGHAEHDDAFYVPKELAAQWEQRDPIQNLLRYIDHIGSREPFDQSGIDQRITREVDEALEWAEQSELPDPTSQTERVYATELTAPQSALDSPR